MRLDSADLFQGMPARNFEKLLLWKQSMELVEAVYRVTKKFPQEEKSGLVGALRKSATTIPAKIADGYGSGNDDQYLKSMAVALGSIREMQTHFALSRRLRYLSTYRHWSIRRRLDWFYREIEQAIDELEEGKSSLAKENKPPVHEERGKPRAA